VINYARQVQRLRACADLAADLAEHDAPAEQLAAAAEFLARPAIHPQAALPLNHAANAGLITGGQPDSAGCCVPIAREPEGER
jgi:hypothetical protein